MKSQEATERRMRSTARALNDKRSQLQDQNVDLRIRISDLSKIAAKTPAYRVWRLRRLRERLEHLKEAEQFQSCALATVTLARNLMFSTVRMTQDAEHPKNLDDGRENMPRINAETSPEHRVTH